MRVRSAYSVRALLMFVLVAIGAGYLFRRHLGVPRLVIAMVAYSALVILLRSHQVLLGVSHCVGFGVLLFFAWKLDNTAGLLPTLFTVFYVWSVYETAAVLIRSRRDRNQCVGERRP